MPDPAPIDTWWQRRELTPAEDAALEYLSEMLAESETVRTDRERDEFIFKHLPIGGDPLEMQQRFDSPSPDQAPQPVPQPSVSAEPIPELPPAAASALAYLAQPTQPPTAPKRSWSREELHDLAQEDKWERAVLAGTAKAWERPALTPPPVPLLVTKRPALAEAVRCYVPPYLRDASPAAGKRPRSFPYLRDKERITGLVVGIQPAKPGHYLQTAYVRAAAEAAANALVKELRRIPLPITTPIRPGDIISARRDGNRITADIYHRPGKHTPTSIQNTKKWEAGRSQPASIAWTRITTAAVEIGVIASDAAKNPGLRVASIPPAMLPAATPGGTVFLGLDAAGAWSLWPQTPAKVSPGREKAPQASPTTAPPRGGKGMGM